LARIDKYGNLIIPLYGLCQNSVDILSLQFIKPNGEKLFLSGGQKKSCFFAIGRSETSRLLIYEGYATGASLHEESGQQVLVAFDAGNLEAVAEGVRSRNRHAEIIICGDNDSSGVGEKKARAAALACNGKS
jgi:putative DNA primase/helicase